MATDIFMRKYFRNKYNIDSSNRLGRIAKLQEI